jgi:hypothetical protein
MERGFWAMTEQIRPAGIENRIIYLEEKEQCP